MLTLEVLICTLDEGIENVIQNILPPIEGVSYLISWQQTRSCSELPDTTDLQRPDVRIKTLQGKGLSKNRNHAFSHAQGNLLLITDDDVKYKPEYFDTVRSAFEKYPEADILTFQMETFEGKPIKNYPSESYLYANRPKGTYISSWEIAVRRRFPIPKFNLHFGLGAESNFIGCGEEEIFIEEAFRKGAHIRYIPSVIGQTAYATTGTHFLSDVKVRRAKGAVLYYIHGYLGATLRCLKQALRLPKCKLKYFKDMYDGIIYARHIFR